MRTTPAAAIAAAIAVVGGVVGVVGVGGGDNQGSVTYRN